MRIVSWCACGILWIKQELHTTLWSGNLKGRYHLRDLDMGRQAIPKMDPKELYRFFLLEERQLPVYIVAHLLNSGHQLNL
jgi:hypothetical protein